jgi:NRAMP (natural resistance-associated macrophage protein)-like metal ion transporter
VRVRSRALLLAAVVGPGLLAGLSDDDAPGVTTYSILGADYGYQLLWVLLLSTGALVLFHELGLRVGVVTGQGLAGLVRERFGVRLGIAALAALVIANLGTTAAEFAGVAASMELAGVSRYASVPLAAFGVSYLVLRGGFRGIEHILLALSAMLATYILAGILAHPDWQAAGRGLVVPTLPLDRDALLVVTATIGTTLAPWGLAFIQSYAVDKRLAARQLPYARTEVVIGSLLTGVVGFFIVVACAATLYEQGRSIGDAADAAAALEPLAGGLASLLFGAGLLGASLLAASILPLSTAYSVAEALGSEAALDDPVREARLFYGTYATVVAIAAAIVLLPSAPLIPILFLSQVLNAVLLLPLMWFLIRIARDREIMGANASETLHFILCLAALALVGVSVAALALLTLA